MLRCQHGFVLCSFRLVGPHRLTPWRVFAPISASLGAAASKHALPVAVHNQRDTAQHARHHGRRQQRCRHGANTRRFHGGSSHGLHGRRTLGFTSEGASSSILLPCGHGRGICRRGRPGSVPGRRRAHRCRRRCSGSTAAGSRHRLCLRLCRVNNDGRRGRWN